MTLDAPETVTVTTHRVACDGPDNVGGGGALGHPKVYLQIGDEGFVECPYCDRRFVLASSSEAAGHEENSH
jgi:uncharacterized Zn-finger protein